MEESKVKEVPTLTFGNLCREGVDGNEVGKRDPFLVSDKMFIPGVPFSLSTHAACVQGSTLSFAFLRIIKRIVISFVITSLLSFPPLASFALCLS